jgi:hypothetical protein
MELREDTRPSPAAQAEEVIGSTFELSGALLGVLFAIVGLVGGARFHMATFGTIAVGFALLAHGSTMAARWSHADRFSRPAAPDRPNRQARERTEAVGIATEVLGGLAAITLGVVAASEVRPLVVLPVAMLVLGVALLLGGPTQPALAPARVRRWTAARDLVRAGSGVMAMSGLAAIVLGVFALLGGPILKLTLIAVLCIAGALLVAGGALPGRIARRFA